MKAAGPGAVRMLQKAQAALDDPGRGSLPWILLFALLLSAALFTHQFIVEWSYRITFQNLGAQLQQELAADTVFALIVTLGFAAVNRRAANRRADHAAYILVIIVGAALAGIVDATLLRLRFPKLTETGIVHMRGSYVTLSMLLLGSIGAFVYVDRIRARAALARLRTAELERAVAAKRVLGSRLQAMQARVEPQFLFNSLGQVKRLYRQDAVRARRMLDDLIDYLRAAMPQMRSATSTVGQEVALANAYLGVLAASLDYPLHHAADVDQASSGMSFPPMVLLPLIDHALAGDDGPWPDGRSIRIEGCVVDGRLHMRVTDSAAGLAQVRETAAVVALRDRLDALYAGEVRLLLTGAAGSGSLAGIELPAQAAAVSATSPSPVRLSAS